MPRLDNSNPKNLEVLREWGGERWAKVGPFIDEDPGATPPMDVCLECYIGHFRSIDDGLVEHPPYGDGDGDYRCAICDWELDEWQDGEPH